MEENSAFFTAPDPIAPKVPPTPVLIHSSEHGFCDIFRIDRGGRFRALKCLKPEFRGNMLYESLLRKEFEIGYSLSHPHICEYYSLLPVDGLGNCIEMEWVDGRTLESVITQEKPDPVLCDKILDEICDALSYTHSKQVLHRDLKPSNILVTYTNNNVKLIDFGLSDSDTHSILKAPAGTINYTAPEILEGRKAEVRSDIYSFGLIMYRLTKKHRAVARKCSETKPGKRYASMAEVKKAIHSNGPLLSGVLFILMIAAMALIPYMDTIKGWFRRAPVPPEVSAAPVPVPDTAISPKDTLQIPVQTRTTPPVPVKKEKPATKLQPDKEKDVSPEMIDELFRQATDLFD